MTRRAKTVWRLAALLVAVGFSGRLAMDLRRGDALPLGVDVAPLARGLALDMDRPRVLLVADPACRPAGEAVRDLRQRLFAQPHREDRSRAALHLVWSPRTAAAAETRVMARLLSGAGLTHYRDEAGLVEAWARGQTGAAGGCAVQALVLRPGESWSLDRRFDAGRWWVADPPASASGAEFLRRLAAAVREADRTLQGPCPHL